MLVVAVEGIGPAGGLASGAPKLPIRMSPLNFPKFRVAVPRRRGGKRTARREAPCQHAVGGEDVDAPEPGPCGLVALLRILLGLGRRQIVVSDSERRKGLQTNHAKSSTIDGGRRRALQPMGF